MNNFKGILALALAAAAGSVFAQVSFSTAAADSNEPQGDALNVHIGTTVGAGHQMGGKAQFTSGNLTSIDAATYGSEARMYITSPEHAGVFAVIQPFTIATFVVEPVPTGLINMTGTMAGTAMASGDSVDCEFFESFNDAAGAADAAWDTLAFNIPSFVPPTAPPALDLGTIGSDVSHSQVYAAGEIKWYKFTITDGTTAGKYLDIDTEDTVSYLNGSFPNDTEIGLYDSFGNLIDNDDDSGSGFRSLLTFGVGSGTRGIFSTAGDAASEEHDGFNGDVNAGTYYLAVTGWNATFGTSAWDVTTTSTSDGAVVVHFRTDIGGSLQIKNKINQSKKKQRKRTEQLQK